MMEHIRLHDWCPPITDPLSFIEEEDLDNSVIEKILHNKFTDPLISSESEDEEERPQIDWAEIFRKRDEMQNRRRLYVPGLKPVPPYPKRSALHGRLHHIALKVLCETNPTVLGAVSLERPSKRERLLFEEIQDDYQKDRQEFIEWAKTMWTNEHCVRALRPKPLLEAVYESEFNLRARRMQSFPKIYEVAAQIPLSTDHQFTMTLSKELIGVKTRDLPKVQYPALMEQFTLMQSCATPEPCDEHPCWFVLPKKKLVSTLPLTELNQELAQYALDHGTRYIASENALKCLMELDRDWTLPIAVCDVIGPDGEKISVTVLGSEMWVNREPPRVRTYRAYRHLLENALIPLTERYKPTNAASKVAEEPPRQSVEEDLAISSDDDDDEDNLIIIEVEEDKNEEDENKSKKVNDVFIFGESSTSGPNKEKSFDSTEKAEDVYKCVCEGTMFEQPPPRSYRKWRVKDVTSNDKYDVIVHCAHKARGECEEVILEPIPEYQLELGGSMQSDETLRSIALSLMLRPNSTLCNVRIESGSGEVVTFERPDPQQLVSKHQDDIANIVYSTLSQLQGLLPGNYLLKHEPMHGANAILYAPRNTGAAQQLKMEFNNSERAEADEAKSVMVPPTIVPVLLPMHISRKILPCAFTPYEHQLARQPRKPAPKQKPPPQAIKDNEKNEMKKWPKKKNRKHKKKN